MQQETSKDKQIKKKKGRTWAEAAKIVMEIYPKMPLSCRDILQVIKQRNLKELSGNASVACLNSMLHANSRGPDPMFYKVEGKQEYGLKTEIPPGAILLEEDDEGSEASSGDESDDQENNNATSKQSKERKRGKILCVKLPNGYCKNNLPLERMRKFSLNSNNNTKSYSSLRDERQFYNTYSPSNAVSSTSTAGGNSPGKVSPHTHSKRAIKHALKQQQKRRKKTTSIASCATNNLYPRIIMKPLPAPPTSTVNVASLAGNKNESTREIL
uniref:HTH HARE-type domain-containing protein n=1 Tax=Strigamia maritima TaxID=126957 RepID=T1JJ53_STRMM